MTLNGGGQDWAFRFESHQCDAVVMKPGASLRRTVQNEKDGLNGGRGATISSSIEFYIYIYFILKWAYMIFKSECLFNKIFQGCKRERMQQGEILKQKQGQDKNFLDGAD